MSNLLEKDPEILALLDRLRSHLGSNSFVLADHWTPDLCAVGIASPHNLGVLIYISCFGEQPGRFGYELELPPLPGDDLPYQVAGRGFDISFEDLAVIVDTHLQLAKAT